MHRLVICWEKAVITNVPTETLLPRSLYSARVGPPMTNQPHDCAATSSKLKPHLCRRLHSLLCISAPCYQTMMNWLDVKCQQMSGSARSTLPFLKICRMQLWAVSAGTSRCTISRILCRQRTIEDGIRQTVGHRAASTAATCSTCTGTSWRSRFRDRQRRRNQMSPRRCRLVDADDHHGCPHQTSSGRRCQKPARYSGLSQSSSPGSARCHPYTRRCTFLGSTHHQCHCRRYRTGDGHQQRTPVHANHHHLHVGR